MKIKVFTAFSGYDSQCMALDRLAATYRSFSYELVGWSEIDKFAIQAHDAVYPQWAALNYGDISKVEWAAVPDFDLFTYSFPCQSISSAGLQHGFAEGSGTRSSLLWECRKAIEAKKPRFLLMENVKALTQKKFMPDFEKWQKVLEDYGYANFWAVMDATRYGVPQHRERVFMVSILKEEDGAPAYEFPQEFPLDVSIADILEDEVDECYYLSQEQVDRIIAHCDRKKLEGCGFKPGFKAKNETAASVSTKGSGRETDNYVKEEAL